MSGFIGLHIGAGDISLKKKGLYENLCRNACYQAIQLIREGHSALEVATNITILLEDSPLTNAGYGSNLTLDGVVECDASIMDGASLQFGAVGAVTGIKNPIIVAKTLIDNQFKQLPLCRVPPCFLVSTGAYNWAEKNNIITVHPDSLITEKSRKTYQRYKEKLATLQLITNEEKLDTVGVVVVDDSGNVAATCSSGGVLLKQPGRIGQAAVYGCGCWAEKCIKSDYRSVAVTVSGTGEDLIKTTFAKQVADILKTTDNPTDSIYSVIKHHFIESPYLISTTAKLCGLIGVTRYNDGKIEFIWAHTTKSMSIGYMSTKYQNSKVHISQLPGEIGKSILIQEVSV